MTFNNPSPFKAQELLEHSAATSALERGLFTPSSPISLEHAGVSETLVDSLVLKYLLNCGIASGRAISEQLRLPFSVMTDHLRKMKTAQLVAYRGAAYSNDYVHELTQDGHERSARLYERCTYYGSSPVPLPDYIASVAAQSPIRDRPNLSDLKHALKDLLVHPGIFCQLGQALSSVAAIFLYGAPGNGKTSIAERLTKAFGSDIWIPRAVLVDDEIMRIYDPALHEMAEVSDNEEESERVDARWVKIKRPTVIVGGELTLESLELRADKATGIVEAPVHLKSNCGTLVIDDFGRQRVSTTDLLNRWIVPLEKRYDFLNTPGGKKVQFPFEQLTVFATNLEPKELVDEAFLRRIPYKIKALDPSEKDFRRLFQYLAPRMDVQFHQATLDRLVEECYIKQNRPFRFCHVRDLLSQIKNYCVFLEKNVELSPDAVDAAVDNYFSLT